MKATFATAVVVATANALVARDTPPCCFSLSATGGASGAVGQIDDGQTRIGSGLTTSQFCIDVSGAITDGTGRGCHLTPPTSQLQCDDGQVPQPGFSIDSSGKLHHNDSTSFVSCQSGQSDQRNIYTSPAPSDVTGCQPIELQSDKCQAPGAPPGTPAPPPPGPPGPGSPPPIGPAPGPTPGLGSAPGLPGPGPGPFGPSPSPSPSPSGLAPPIAPSPPSASSPCPNTSGPGAPCGSTTPGPPSPGSAGTAGTGGPGTGHVGSTTSCPSNTEGPSGPRTPSAPRSPGGGPTAPGPPPFANSSAPAPTGNVSKPTAPGPTGGVSPTGGVTPAGTCNGGSKGGCGGASPTGGATQTPGAGGGCDSSKGGCGGAAPMGGVTPAPGAGGACGGGSKAGCGGAVCGTTLVNGSFEFPHLIIPIDSSAPSKAPGTSFNGTVTSTISSIFNFDFGQNVTGKQCSLVFLFPTQDQLETSAFSFSGDGAINFAELEAPASNQTSFSNAPQVKVDFGVTNVSPGHSFGITTFACPVGQTLAFELKNSGTTYLDFFEDFNPSPIGLFITTC